MGVDNTVDRGICPLNFALQRKDCLFCAVVVKSRMGFLFTHVGLFVAKISSALKCVKTYYQWGKLFASCTLYLSKATVMKLLEQVNADKTNALQC